MILDKLELFNFRNYQYQDVEFSPHVNLVIGRNAQGKSNLLEAVYYLSHLKSKRTPRTNDLIRQGQASAAVKCLVQDQGRRLVIRIGLGLDGKFAEVNGQKTEPASKAAGLLKCVVFSPDDLYLVKGDPGRRRDFLDETLELLGPVPASGIQRYRHVLRQRNALLKRWEEQGRRLDAVLEPWNEALVEWGSRIVSERLVMTSEMSRMVADSYSRISGGEAETSFVYTPATSLDGVEGMGSIQEVESGMKKALETRLEEEKRARTTLVGPHRDDVEIRINGREARYAASQGEQRTIAFAMRLAQRDFTRSKTGTVPLLLLDDVLSELDERRRKRVLDIARDSQLILTATEVTGGLSRGSERLLVVEAGRVSVGRA